MRSCGDCQLCCKLLPMPEVEKPAGTRCRYQRAGKGCTIYARRPPSCRLWQCRWLAADDTADLSRPDRSHYVVDMIPDHITLAPPDGAEPITFPVLQVWVDPGFPDAHRDPALRAYLYRRALDGFAALIRLDSRRAFVLFAPPFAADGQWHEMGSHTGNPEVIMPGHDLEATLEAMTAAGTAPLTISIGKGS